jgi:hypothetical protein
VGRVGWKLVVALVAAALVSLFVELVEKKLLSLKSATF